MKQILSFVGVFAVTIVSTSYGDLPPGISACNANDYACMATTTNNIIETYYYGNADLNLISIDPLLFDEMVWENATINSCLRLFNLKQYNYRGFRVTSISGFGKDLTGPHQLKLVTPYSTYEGDYSIKGTILGYPVNASDKFGLRTENMELIIYFDGEPWLQNGQNYLNVTNFRLDFCLTRAVFNMSNLVPGNQTQSEFLLNLFNENSLQLTNSWYASIIKAYAPKLEEMIAPVLRSAPYSTLVIGGI